MSHCYRLAVLGIVSMASFVCTESLTAQTAHWIWPSAARTEGSVAEWRYALNCPVGTQQAHLSGISDFCHAQLRLNGKLLIGAEAFGAPFQLDVSRWIREGANTLEILATSSAGPAAIALRFETTALDGKNQIWVTDRGWPSSLSTRNSRTEFPESTDLGEVREFELDPRREFGITPLDDYEQWKQALTVGASTSPSSFLALPGFEVSLVRSAAPEEGSWVSMAVDPQGRLVIAREDKGLLRLTLTRDRRSVAKVETINDSLLECRGLLFAYDSLYVNANNSKGFYRLRDTDGDDQFDEVRLLRQFEGSLGHGRNDLALSPNGGIYLIHGDSVDLPTDCEDLTSPLREQRPRSKSREGHLLRTDRDGKSWQIVAAGLRNPYGIDFHKDREVFTYDADAEFDMGAPWYRPTQVKHLTPGADFGWRGVTGQWPPYYHDHPDNAQANVHIGKGSPTSVKFGYASSFPAPFRDALFSLDWSYGRIIAVHLTPRGASYSGRPENFLKGRPLNVTDLDFGPDGAMYFVTGGRKTQAGLYRVHYGGPKESPPPPTAQQQARASHATEARALRRRLEELLIPGAKETIETAWPHLDSFDPWIRYAARTAIERQPVSQWSDRARSETRTTARLNGLLALARSGDESLRGEVLAQLNQIPLTGLTDSQKVTSLYTYQLCLAKPDNLDGSARDRAVAQFDAIYPDRSPGTNRYLSLLLSQMNATHTVSKTIDLLSASREQAERMHYLFALRNVSAGWTMPHRLAYADALTQMAANVGGEGMPGFLKQIRADHWATLTDEEKEKLKPWLNPDPSTVDEPLPQRPVVQAWNMADLAEIATEVGNPRDLANGGRMFTAALCVRCHRVGSQGQVVGPDLSGVSRRFSRRDILQSVIEPSGVVAENYRNDRIETTDGRVLVGRIVASGDFRSPLLRINTEPLNPRQISEVAKRDVVSHTSLPTSPMPAGLLNTLTKDEIRDLLAFIESGGDVK